MLRVRKTGASRAAVGLMDEELDDEELVILGTVYTTSLLTVSSRVEVTGLLFSKNVTKLVYVVK